VNQAVFAFAFETTHKPFAMLDRHSTAMIKPGVVALATVLHRWGCRADHITWAGFLLGVVAAVLISQQAYTWGLLMVLVSRLLDALDGAVARLTGATDAGGFLDIALDFLFYAMVPLAFALADPQRNALAAAVLLAAFIGTGSSFLAFAVLAAKRGLDNTSVPNKSFYFLGGLTEATETLAVFAAMCWWPHHFAAFAYGFSILCAITIITRIGWGWHRLKQPD
jgi:phosphatidylglycerophosphate synthase